MNEGPLWWEIIWTLGVWAGMFSTGWALRGWIDKGEPNKGGDELYDAKEHEGRYP